MYRCQSCGVLVPTGTRALWVTTQVRRKRYSFRAAAIPVQGKGRKKRRRRDDVGGIGIERMNSLKVCSVCYKKLTDAGPEVMEDLVVDLVVEAPPEQPSHRRHHMDDDDDGYDD
jgi:hypothetical protein